MIRCYGQPGRWLLQEALAHPDVGVRYQGLVTARLCCPDWAQIFRNRPMDSDPNNRLRTLEWLQENGPLTPAEWELVEQLMETPGTGSRARKLLDLRQV